jgi:NAD(P)-dependent dehydrogenase (short-subunit alcohol dehydrogenase family)
MLDQGEGKIINIASVHALRADSEDNSSGYCSSKGAVVSFTRELAKQWAPRGLRVNCIAPGLFPTEMTTWYFEEAEREERVLASIPSRRFGCANDAKGLIVFLASDAANYIVGQTIVIDGGQILS